MIADGWEVGRGSGGPGAVHLNGGGLGLAARARHAA